MDDVISLINHLLNTNYSIDRIDFIVNHLNISKDRLLRLINDDHYKDYFQLLHSSNTHDQSSEKLALTVDVSVIKKRPEQILLFCNLALLLYTLCSTM
jgi:hypothetical protein